MARNAKDTVVSYFHFEQMFALDPEPGDWSSFLQKFMDGRGMYEMQWFQSGCDILFSQTILQYS